jgi:hypothetical protein
MVKKSNANDKDEKLAHIQKFFRMVLSDDSTLYYYSFCQEDVLDDNCHWHCIKCKKCLGWREWHCGECDKCMFIYLLEYVNYVDLF